MVKRRPRERSSGVFRDCVLSTFVAKPEVSGSPEDFAHHLLCGRVVWGERPHYAMVSRERPHDLRLIYSHTATVRDAAQYLWNYHPILGCLFAVDRHPLWISKRVAILLVVLATTFSNVELELPDYTGTGMTEAVVATVLDIALRNLLTCHCSQRPHRPNRPSLVKYAAALFRWAAFAAVCLVAFGFAVISFHVVLRQHARCALASNNVNNFCLDTVDFTPHAVSADPEMTCQRSVDMTKATAGFQAWAGVVFGSDVCAAREPINTAAVARNNQMQCCGGNPVRCEPGAPANVEDAPQLSFCQQGFYCSGNGTTHSSLQSWTGYNSNQLAKDAPFLSFVNNATDPCVGLNEIYFCQYGCVSHEVPDLKPAAKLVAHVQIQAWCLLWPVFSIVLFMVSHCREKHKMAQNPEYFVKGGLAVQQPPPLNTGVVRAVGKFKLKARHTSCTASIDIESADDDDGNISEYYSDDERVPNAELTQAELEANQIARKKRVRDARSVVPVSAREVAARKRWLRKHRRTKSYYSSGSTQAGITPQKDQIIFSQEELDEWRNSQMLKNLYADKMGVELDTTVATASAEQHGTVKAPADPGLADECDENPYVPLELQPKEKPKDEAALTLEAFRLLAGAHAEREDASQATVRAQKWREDILQQRRRQVPMLAPIQLPSLKEDTRFGRSLAVGPGSSLPPIAVGCTVACGSGVVAAAAPK
jgi:hypothetical protein